MKKGNLRGLAWRVVSAYRVMDYWDYTDTYEDMKEALFCTLSQLEKDPRPIFDALEEWESRTDDADMRRTLAGIRQDVAELMVGVMA